MKNKKETCVFLLTAIACCFTQAVAGSDVPALKDVFKDYFLIGGALNRRVVMGQDPKAAEIAIRHFNTATPENDMKWSLIHPRPDQYNWEPADRFVEFCLKNEMVPIGHTLVWHSQVPDWVFQDDSGRPLTRQALLDRMQSHISAVVGRYKGRVKGWDVVNEALNDDGTMRDTPWYRIIGQGDPQQRYDHIAKAFEFAHKADPQAELYYNDYSLSTSRAKADAAAAIVRYLQSKGIRIDGVGMQMHASLTWPNVEDFEYAIKTLAATGVNVMITELDIRTRSRGYRGADISRIEREGSAESDAAAAELQKQLAEKYAEIFTVLVKYKEVIPRVTFWGVYDATSWIGGSPLLFDAQYQPKQAFYAVVNVVRGGTSAPNKPAQNPIIWADVPDVAAIRVGDTYYMASTTMHMSPGLPIMKSKNLVNWELIGYAYDTLTDNAALRLENGKNAYGAGSWAPCLRYHEGTFYATTFSSTSGRTHIYTTADIESGQWEEISFSPSLHDHSLFFDDDGRVYMLYGVGDLRLVELKPDLTGIKPDGFNEVVIRNASAVAGPNIGLPAEGSQMRKINGKYYVMNITWPRGGMRTQIVHRADTITGPYEGRVVLQDKGVAQGCLIDTPDGKWYALLFQDTGAVGRCPWLVPVRWEDGWPVLGIDGKAPITLDIEDNGQGLANIVASDEFDRAPGQPLPLAWQWNHNPDNRCWSMGERKGYLRLTTGRVDSDILQARNTLTQRTFGPVCSATTKLEVGRMKDGDCAGLIALQKRYGYVGVRMEGGRKSIVMVSAQSERPEEVQRIPLQQQTVYLKIDCDFRNRTDKAYFYYSLDGLQWTKIGSTLQMAYTLPHFMGYRFGLFNFATQTTGGFVDFDYYRISDKIALAD